MDKYLFLLIAVFLFVPWFVVWFFREDLRQRMLKAGVGASIFGPLLESWFLRDYWRPPFIFEEPFIPIEDVIFGFVIAGLAVSLYDAVFGVKNIGAEKSRKKIFGVLFILCFVSLIVFNNWLGFNTVFVNTFTFLLLTVVMLWMRRDLVMPAIFSGVLTALVSIPIYMFLFNWLSPSYWDSYWFLADTEYGMTVIGNIPLTELLWYFSWGCFAGAGYNFVSGQAKVKYARYSF